MAKIQSLSLRRACQAVVFVCFFFAIAGLTYLGFRPEQSHAEAYTTLEIPSISLSTDVSEVELEGKTLTAPEKIAGVYHAAKNTEFLMGHSSTIFENLHLVEKGAKIVYSGANYTVSSVFVQAKSDIRMNELLAPSKKPTLVLMTCFGEPLEGQDFSHRLIIVAEKEPET